MPPPIAAAVNSEDIRRAYQQHAGWSMFPIEMQLQPLQLIVMDSSTDKLYRVAVKIKADGSFEFGDPVEVAIEYSDVAKAAAASAVVWASTRIVAAVSDKPWGDFTQADYTPEQWRAACLVDTGEGDPDSKARYKLPVKEPGGAINRNGAHAAAQRIGQLDVSAELKSRAARALVRIYRNDLDEDPPQSLLDLAGSQASQPAVAGTAQSKGAGMDPAKLRESLGLSADASDDEVRTALTSAGVITASTTEPPPPPPPTQPGQPGDGDDEEPGGQTTAPPPPRSGVMQIDAAAWNQQLEVTKQLQKQLDRFKTEERDKVIAQAMSDGKFPPARAEDWRRQWDANPDGTRTLIAGLAKHVVPTEVAGYAGDDDSELDDEYKHLFPPEPVREGR